MRSLSERQIAEEKVKPYLRKRGFSEDLISDYDVVLVQFGTTTGRVDFVCYHLRGDRKLPFLVVEVKTPEEDLDPLQAESYAQRLDAPFFAVTNGDEWHWYLTGKGQSNSIRLNDCPIPLSYLRPMVHTVEVEHKKEVLELITVYENKLKHDSRKCPRDYKKCSFMERPYRECDSCLVWNVVWINWALDQLAKLCAEFRQMRVSHLIAILASRDVLWSIYPQNALMISRWIQNDVQGAKNTIAYLINEEIPIEERFDNVVSGKYHVPGIGPFLASMLFAGIDRRKYTIISNRNLEGLKRLGLIDTQPTVFRGIDYLNFNKLMLRLSEHFRDEFGFGKTALVHDFTLLVSNYIDTGRWRG